MEPKTIFLSLDDVTMDKACQPRAAIDEAVVAEYSAEMIAEAQFPPVIVYFDGAVHWLADGYHRVHAARRAGFTNVLAEVRAGTRRDAVLHACGANRDHGLRRTNADKRRAVETLFSDAEWKVWSDETIAKHCGTSREFVTRLRLQPGPSLPLR